MKYVAILALVAAAIGIPSTEQAQIKGPRIRQYVNVGGGTSVLTGELYDMTLQTECTLLPAADGKTRCLPVTHNREKDYGMYNMWIFSDDTCSNPLSSLATERFALFLDDTAWTYQVYDVVDSKPFVGPVYNLITGRGCIRIGISGQEPPSGEQRIDAYPAKLHPLTDFAAFTRTLF